MTKENFINLERVTGFEPAIFSLEGRRVATTPHPLSFYFNHSLSFDNIF